MEIRSLGATDIPVTPLGLGLAALGRPGYINLGHAGDLQQNYDVQFMEERAHAVLDAAWQAGIRYFDAARSYGRAEAFLASWLMTRDIAPEAITIGSKWGYTYTAGWQVTALHHEIKDHSLAVLQRQIGESRGLLGAYLDLYQIHSATLESGVLENLAVLGQLAQLRDQGLAIGLSTSGPRQSETIRKAMDIQVGGAPLFAAVQATWNVLAQEAGEALQEAHEAGLGVIVKEALANGRLTSRNEDPAFADQRARLQAVATAQDTTIDALALAAALAQPWADVVLSGAATIAHLESNAKALQLRDLSWLGEISNRLVEEPEAYWKTRSELDWN